jgi:hypothetical protein
LTARTIHPFPARMAPAIATDWIPSATAVGPLTIADPMCGSGTVLTAALQRGHRAVGVDMDPLAVLMSEVATKGFGLKINDEFAERLTLGAKAVAETAIVPVWWDAETAKFAAFWFGPRQLRELVGLSVLIAQIEDEGMRKASSVALSKIIVTKAPKASLAADTSHSRPHRVIETSDYDVFTGFRRAVKDLQAASGKGCPSNVTVYRGDARATPLADKSIDMVVTSPPYLNAIDYMRGHRMSLIWLGYNLGELRAIRSESIGTERALPHGGAELVDSITFAALAHVDDVRSVPLLGVIRRYTNDMIQLAREIARIGSSEASALLVVGNSTVRGTFVPNDRIAERAMNEFGFAVRDRWEREIPANKRYLPIQSDNGAVASRMRTEVVTSYSRATS